MTEVERLRLFVAATVPPDLLEGLAAATRSLRDRWSSARWTEPANQHVTLKFLGPTPADRLDAVRSVIEMVARGSTGGTLRLGGLGAFPTTSRARVLWASVQDPADTLAGVADDLARAFEPLGYAAESRPFRAHLTLARFRVPQRLGELPQLGDGEPFDVDAVHLFRSRLHPKGARYEVLGSFSLGAPE